MDNLEDTQMQDFLGVPSLILAAILGALCIFLLATGLCKAAQLLRSPILPDVVPTIGSQTYHCALRALARNPAANAPPCLIKVEELHTAPADKHPSLLTPKLETQRKSPTPEHTTPLASNSPPSGSAADGKTDKIELLNKEPSYPRSFH